MIKLKIRDGWLIGNAPCQRCIELWLTERNVHHEPCELSDIPNHLSFFNLPIGIFYEVYSDNTYTKLDCYIEKNPNCICNNNTIKAQTKKLNFAFSSIREIKCARYGTPTGNLWVASATKRGITTLAASDNREDARNKAALPNTMPIEEQYGNPLLIVGTSTWIRERVPFFLLQQFDIHLLFYPTSKEVYQIGILAQSRIGQQPPIFVYGQGASTIDAIMNAIYELVVFVVPDEWKTDKENAKELSKLDKVRHLWYTNWIYRQAKVSLRDILHLESYKIEHKVIYKLKLNVCVKLLKAS